MTGNKETTVLTLLLFVQCTDKTLENYRECKIKLDKYISKLLHESENVYVVLRDTKENKAKQQS